MQFAYSIRMVAVPELRCISRLQTCGKQIGARCAIGQQQATGSEQFIKSISHIRKTTMQPALNRPWMSSESSDRLQQTQLPQECGNALINEPLLERIIIDDDARFADLADEWNRLLARCAAPTVFMRWEWHHTWWQVYAGCRDRLHIITWRCNGELVGLLPLYRKPCHLIPGRVCLRLLGTGESRVDEVVTEYADLLLEPRLSAEIGALATDYLLQFKGWTRIEMSCLLEGSALHQALTRDGRRPSRASVAGYRYRTRLDVDDSRYLEQLGSSRAKRIRRSRRAVEKAGGLLSSAVETVEGFDQAFQELADLNHERQAHKGRKSVFASERFRRFHQLLCRRLHVEGAVDIVRFRLGSRLLAVLYCFYDGDTCYYYQSGFARRDANRFMPLTLAHLAEMQRNRQAGRHYYDFMRGDADSYKRDFNCDTHAMVDISVYRWQWQSLLATLYRRSRSRLARARHLIPSL